MSRTRFKGFSSVAYNLSHIAGAKLDAATKAGMEGAGSLALEAVRKNVTRQDHSQASLDRLDNPYAKRHGSIRVHPNEQHVVHSQSGRMAASLEGKPISRRGKHGYRIGFGKGAPKWVPHVIIGTKVMLGRDVIGITTSSPAIRKKMMREMINVMGRDMRSQAGLRFGR